MGKRIKTNHTTYTKVLKNAIVRLAAEGKTIDEIAECLGISRQTLYVWKKDNEELSDAITKARNPANLLVEQSLLRRATGIQTKKPLLKRDGTPIYDEDGRLIFVDDTYYPPDVRAQEFWLRNRDPENWTDRKEIDQTTKETRTVKVDFKKEDINQLIDTIRKEANNE